MAQFIITENGAYIRLDAIDLIERVVGGYMAILPSGKFHRLHEGFDPHTSLTIISQPKRAKKLEIKSA